MKNQCVECGLDQPQGKSYCIRCSAKPFAEDAESRKSSNSRKSRKHVRIDSTGLFTCLHCKDAYQMNLPCLMDVVIAASKAYLRVHGSCRESSHAAN